MTLLPLIVDLDGTLIHTDMLHETVLGTLRDNPLGIFRIPLWLSRGKAVLKRNLARQTDVDAAHLPYNDDLINWLRHERAQGRKLILCTASDRSIAETVSSHLGIFDEVMASDGVTNLSGTQKAKALEQRFGKSGFDYAGNSLTDLAVWRCSRNGVVVNASRSVARQAEDICHVEQVFPPKKIKLTTWRKALRIHQWMKNLLLFIPLLAAHQITNFAALQSLLLAFVSFSLCASAVYLSNDLLDLESDRQHPRKRNRPFASGALPVWVGVALTPLLLVASATLATHVGGTFFRWLLLYFVLTCAYSFGIKRIMLMDCLALAMLYTIRIVAGAAAAKLSPSFWLLAFAVFLFLSLAYVKRYAELELQLAHGRTKALGRGYYTSDAPLVQTLGISAGYASVVVLALYLNSEAVTKLYRTPEVIWAAVPILAFWVSWMWMQAHRGNMHDDPLVFAFKDVASLLAGVAFAIVLAIGAVF